MTPSIRQMQTLSMLCTLVKTHSDNNRKTIAIFQKAMLEQMNLARIESIKFQSKKDLEKAKLETIEKMIGGRIA